MTDPVPFRFKSKIIRTKLADWQSFSFIQQDNFKELLPGPREKLKSSILNNDFTQPFYVWQDQESKEIFCLDGKHRTIILHELKTEGHDIPDKLPATFINCKDKEEAAKLVLIYSSIYANITTEGFQDFIAEYGLLEEQLKLSVNIPGLVIDESVVAPIDSFNDEGIGVKNQFGVIVICENEEQQEKVFKDLSAMGLTCKVVVT